MTETSPLSAPTETLYIEKRMLGFHSCPLWHKMHLFPGGKKQALFLPRCMHTDVFLFEDDTSTQSSAKIQLTHTNAFVLDLLLFLSIKVHPVFNLSWQTK